MSERRPSGRRAAALGRLAAALATTAFLLRSGPCPAGDEPSGRPIVLRRCVVKYERDTSVGAATPGILKECLVEPGTRVRAGQVLGRLRDDEARVEADLRRSEAENDVEVRLAEARRERAIQGLRVAEALARRDVMSREEYSLKRMEAEVAVLELEQAHYRRRVAAIRLKQAEAAADSLTLASPHDGIVAAVLKRPGEPVDVDEPVFRLVDPDRLLAVGLADVTDAWSVEPGQPVRVSPEIQGAELDLEREVFEGNVAFVDHQIDPETRTCTVVARIANRDGLLRSGLEASMEILRTSDLAALAAGPGRPRPATIDTSRATTPR